jgi:Tol biopolymer transport system component
MELIMPPTHRRIAGLFTFLLFALASQAAKPQTPLAPRVGLARSEAGYILYTRHEVIQTQAAGVRPLPVPKIYSMTADGREQRPFIAPAGSFGFVEARQPAFSPDYKSVLFTSNYETARSALFTDVFKLDLATGSILRLSGAEWSAGYIKGRGTIFGIVQLGYADVAPLAVSISVQGMNGQIFKLKGEMADAQGKVLQGQYTYVIENVPAGKVWVKCWHSRHKGDLKYVDVAANRQNVVATMHLNEGNWLVTNPSISSDGRLVAVLSQHAWYLNQSPGMVQPGDPRGVSEQGFDTLALLDLAKAGQLVFMWEPTKMRGQAAKDPRLSPDGRFVAFTMGEMPAESLAIASVDSLLRGAPDVRVVAAGQRALGVGAVSCGQPAWSPDGRRLAFIRFQSDLNLNFTGNLCVVNADGTGMALITQVRLNQCVTNPCWSPDATRLATGLVTSRRPALNALDLAGMNISSDIWTIGADGTNPRQLTADGRSSEPAWGR